MGMALGDSVGVSSRIRVILPGFRIRGESSLPTVIGSFQTVLPTCPSRTCGGPGPKEWAGVKRALACMPAPAGQWSQIDARPAARWLARFRLILADIRRPRFGGL